MELLPKGQARHASARVEERADRDHVRHPTSPPEPKVGLHRLDGPAVEHRVRHDRVPGDHVPVGHFVEQAARQSESARLEVHVQRGARDEGVVGKVAEPEREGVHLRPDGRGAARRRGGGGLEGGREGEVVGAEAEAEHGGERRERLERARVLRRARDEGRVGHYGGAGVRGQRSGGGAREVELGVEVDEVRTDEGREGRSQQPQRARVRRSAEPRGPGGDRRLDRAR